MPVPLRFLALLLLGACAACFNGGTSRHQLSDTWFISGQIADPSFFAKEILALGMDGTRYRSLIDADNAFSLDLPGNSVYAFYVIPDPALSKSPAAILTFEDGKKMDVSSTLRLPKTIPYAQLDLGSLDIKQGQAWPTRNPSRYLDFDSDGIVDILDPDDQNDGLKDSKQKYDTERVGLCHHDEDRQKFIFAPLETLLSHLQHGDNVGHCQPKKL
jgi:hypothetical protein